MIRPVIMAAGEGRRMGLQETSKVMLSVDRLRPMIGNIAMTLLGMSYKSRDINVIVGHKSEQIINYLGTDISFCHQSKIGNPTDGVREWLEACELTENPDLVAYLNADDSPWLDRNDLQNLFRYCDDHDTEGMLLTSHYEPGQHKIGFIQQEYRIVDSSEAWSNPALRVGGAFVVRANKFYNYINQTDGNIVNYFADKEFDKDLVLSVVDRQPRNCINTQDALFAARSLYHTRHRR